MRLMPGARRYKNYDTSDLEVRVNVRREGGRRVAAIQLTRVSQS